MARSLLSVLKSHGLNCFGLRGPRLCLGRADRRENLCSPALPAIREIPVNNAALRRFIQAGRQHI